ncbi:TATA-box-binding protein (TATA-box factor)-like protein [Leptotrombidium deliense]|uniref:TATA-box-binding protein (TATA-box factor)-like protein n=1 Tax=Leptotrombidium deliense TaxID=299467 RepID=A0A443S422_9ACAR|nr:TATA-box-binding protein (TATA-box factor)-like protein [Leptotrombidium deliense]
MIATASLNCVVPLDELSRKLDYFCYNKAKFSGAIWKMKTPKVTVLVFSNGKIVVNGAKSEYIICRTIKKVVKTFQSFKIIAMASYIKDQIIMATTSENFSFYKLCQNKDIIYEPEIFRSAIINPNRNIKVIPKMC